MIKKLILILLLKTHVAHANNFNPRKEDDYHRLVIYFSTLLKKGFSPEQALESVNFNSMPPMVRIGYIHALLSTGEVFYRNNCIENHRYFYENKFRKELHKYEKQSNQLAEHRKNYNKCIDRYTYLSILEKKSQTFKKSISILQKVIHSLRRIAPMSVVLSQYQKDIIEMVSNTKKNIGINAVAGSGKSSVLEWSYNAGKTNCPNSVFVAFNKHIADSLVKRGLPARTLHSIGMEILKNTLPEKPAAGSGKSSVLEWSYNAGMSNCPNSVFVAFNKHIADSLVKRGLPARTLHSIGMEILKNTLPEKPAVNNNKIFNIINKNCSEGVRSKYAIIIRNVINFAKSIGLTTKSLASNNSNLIPASAGMWAELIEEEDLSEHLPAPWEQHYKQAKSKLIEDLTFLIIDIFEKSVELKKEIDFTDMIYFPVLFQKNHHFYSNVFADEIQDQNILQHLFTDLLMDKEDRRFIGVGDFRQAIMAFSGADSSSMEKLIAKYKCDILPLSVCYRCPKEVVRLAQRIVPHIQYSESQIEGEITHFGMYQDKIVKKGDMIICRNNAPLMEIAFDVLQKNIPLNMKGVGIKKSMDSVLKIIRKSDLPFSKGIEAWYESAAVVNEKDEKSKVKNADEIYDCFMSISKKIKSKKLEKIKCAVEMLFENSHDNPEAVKLSSIHRAKGLEAKRVIILNSHLIGKYAQTEEEKTQEENLRYVAYTRAKEELVFADTKPRFS